jgi:peptidoglycan/LPS O-acetylase OafA/YrhL
MGMQNKSKQMKSSSGRFHQLDSIRGIAAMAVVLSHCLIIIRQDNTHPDWLGSIIDGFYFSPFSGLTAGLPAVLLFFTLSGFALTQMLHGSEQTYSAYCAKRVARIWLPYLASIAISLIIISTIGWPEGKFIGKWLNGVIGRPINFDDIFMHILLVAPFEAHYNFITWTLSHELRISLAFPFLLKVLAKQDIKKSLIILLSISAAALASTYTAKYFNFINLSNLLVSFHYMLFFGIGALMAIHRQSMQTFYEKLSTKTRFTIYGFALLSYTYPSMIRGFHVSLQNFPMLFTHWAILPGVSIIIATAICNKGFQKFLCAPSLRWLGKVSYSLYLFHGIILIAACHIAVALGTPFAMAVGLFASITIAGIAYRWIELPSQNWGRELASKIQAARLAS